MDYTFFDYFCTAFVARHQRATAQEAARHCSKYSMQEKRDETCVFIFSAYRAACQRHHPTEVGQHRAVSRWRLDATLPLEEDPEGELSACQRRGCRTLW